MEDKKELLTRLVEEYSDNWSLLFKDLNDLYPISWNNLLILAVSVIDLVVKDHRELQDILEQGYCVREYNRLVRKINKLNLTSFKRRNN